jgi:alkylhydroperoxidase family enzyme
MASHTALARRHGWSEEQLSDLANFRNRSDFTDAEKAALELAERMTLDSNGVDDLFWNELRRYYDEGEIIELLAAIGLFNYFNRFNNALQMEPTK